MVMATAKLTRTVERDPRVTEADRRPDGRGRGRCAEGRRPGPATPNAGDRRCAAHRATGTPPSAAFRAAVEARAQAPPRSCRTDSAGLDIRIAQPERHADCRPAGLQAAGQPHRGAADRRQFGAGPVPPFKGITDSAAPVDRQPDHDRGDRELPGGVNSRGSLDLVRFPEDAHRAGLPLWEACEKRGANDQERAVAARHAFAVRHRRPGRGALQPRRRTARRSPPSARRLGIGGQADPGGKSSRSGPADPRADGSGRTNRRSRISARSRSVTTTASTAEQPARRNTGRQPARPRAQVRLSAIAPPHAPEEPATGWRSGRRSPRRTAT